MRRWRGTIDVPLTDAGRWGAVDLGMKLRLDRIYHDRLFRCRVTARLMAPAQSVATDGPRPWHMGPQFEGREITPESLEQARWLVRNSTVAPVGGECFNDWYCDWIGWLSTLPYNGYAAVGIVTHNRNIQALYSRHDSVFYPHLYDCVGPDFLSVHVYDRGHIAPWGGNTVPPGIYLIRHGPTAWGT